MDFIINVLEQGLIFSLVALGVFITYKILDFPDLSVDGTFPLGAAVTSVLLLKGINPYITTVIAFVCGAFAGLITGLLHVKLKITNLLSGILVMIGLYSINLRIMGKSNIPLFNSKNIFNNISKPIIILLIFTLLFKVIVDLFLDTKLGFLLKAVGDNEQIVTTLGVNKDNIKIIGLMLSNGLVSISGAIMAQYQGFADVGMGTGTVVMGLAAVIMGESLLKKVKLIKFTTTALLGAILYKLSIAFALKMGLATTDLKLITAIIVTLALSINNRALSFSFKRNLQKGDEINVKDRKAVESI